MKSHSCTIEASASGCRLDLALAQSFKELSRTKIGALIKNGNVYRQLTSGEQVLVSSNSHKVHEGEVYLLIEPKGEPTHTVVPLKGAFPLPIIFEDEYLAVINKPAGLVVHKGAGSHEYTLVDLLVGCFPKLSSIGEEGRPGLVHRLDKNTSGLIVIAKDDNTHAQLATQFSEHTIKRNYRAAVWGFMPGASGVVDNIIGRSSANRQKMAVLSEEWHFQQPKAILTSKDFPANARGKRAITHYKSLAVSENSNVSLIDCSLHTGRTHQIRVHMSYLGHPLLGDTLYGRRKSVKKQGLNEEELAYVNTFLSNGRQALHAYLLEFYHPRQKQRLCFTESEPEDLKKLYSIIFKGTFE